MAIRECGPEDFCGIYAVVNDAAEAYRSRIPDDCWHEPYMSKEALARDIESGVVFYCSFQSTVMETEDGKLKASEDRRLKTQDRRQRTEDRKQSAVHGPAEDGRPKAGDLKLVGVMGLQEVGDVSLIRHSYVLTESQGKGIGSGLIRHLLKEAHADTVLVGTWAAATWAIGFYEKNGFMLVGPEEKDILLRKYWTISDRQIESSVVLKLHLA
ncbi:MAG: GNAT family N-acetyltransferase [Candidatus Altiarchaeota archaeon]